jgi:hypothetical protein
MALRLLVCLSILVLAPSLAWADITSNLVIHWPADTGTGTNVPDVTAGGHNGTLAGGATWVSPGKVGASALSFDGVSGVMTWTALATGTTYTIAAWIFPIPSSTSYGPLFATTSAGNGFFYYNNGSLDLYTGLDKISTTTMTENAWHHVAVSVNAGAYTFYIDGVSAGTGTGITDIIPSSAGGSTGGEFFKGYIDDLRFYTRALSAGDIAELIALGTAAVTARKRPLLY